MSDQQTAIPDTGDTFFFPLAEGTPVTAICARGAGFDPFAWIDFFREQALDAEKQGYAGTLVTIDMDWVLHGNPDPAGAIITYERKLEQIIHDLPLMVMCSYGKDTFQAEVLLEVLRVHPTLFITGEAIENLYYVSAKEQAELVELVERRLEHLAMMRKTDEIILKSTQHYSRILETIQEGFLMIDTEEKIIQVNHQIMDMLGYGEADLIGRPLSEFIIWEGQQSIHSFLDDSSVQLQGQDLLFRRKDGSIAWMTISFRPFDSQEGNPSGAIGMMIDSTERKLAEEALNLAYEEMERRVEQRTHELALANQRIYRSEANLNAIYNSSREIILLFDPQYHLLSFNRVAQDTIFFFFQKQIQEGSHITEILPLQFAERIQRLFQRVLTGEYIQQEQKYIAPGGELQWFELNLFPIHILPQDEIHIGVTGNDVTERKRLSAAENAAQEFAEVLTKTLSDISGDEDINLVLGRLLQYFRRVVAYDQALLLLAEGKQLQVIASKGFSSTSSILEMSFPTNHPLFQIPMQTRGPAQIGDSLLDPRFAVFYPQVWARSWAILPLVTRQNPFGYLMMGMRLPDSIQENHIRLAFAFAGEAALAIENARLFQQLHQIAITDSLTGAYSRRHLIELAEQELDRAHRYRHPLSIILLDIDYFKRVNDTYGHVAGDFVLARLVDMITPELRHSDILGRFGGEEFIILLPETDSQDAFEAAERIRRKVAANPIGINDETIPITISLGVASYDLECKRIDAFFNQADKAMYAAKQAGRNRSILWNEKQV